MQEFFTDLVIDFAKGAALTLIVLAAAILGAYYGSEYLWGLIRASS